MPRGCGMVSPCHMESDGLRGGARRMMCPKASSARGRGAVELGVRRTERGGGLCWVELLGTPQLLGKSGGCGEQRAGSCIRFLTPALVCFGVQSIPPLHLPVLPFVLWRAGSRGKFPSEHVVN